MSNQNNRKRGPNPRLARISETRSRSCARSMSSCVMTTADWVTLNPCGSDVVVGSFIPAMQYDTKSGMASFQLISASIHQEINYG